MKLLFDCDGTLIDSMGLWQKSMKDLIKKSDHILDAMSKEDRINIESLSYDKCIKYIWGHFSKKMSEEEVKKYFDNILEDGYKNFIPAKDGVIDTLKSLKTRGYEMAIASSNSTYLLEMVLKRLEIYDFFEHFFTPDLTGLKKDEKDFWINAANRLSAKPGDVILFDDAAYALMAAKDAGLVVCAIKDFPYNEDLWDDIIAISDYTSDSISDFAYDSL